MVNFSVFNELSLPFQKSSEFEDFFKVLENLKKNGINKIRMDKKFSDFPEILPNTTFQQLIGQEGNRDKRRRFLSFQNSSIAVIETPLIKSDEDENEKLLENEYFYKKKSNIGGLACCHIWNTIAISSNSKKEWDRYNIVLQKQTILDNKEIDIKICHASKMEHLVQHKSFFDDLENERRLDINQDNFWDRREEFFPKKIVLCKEVEKQIKNIDKTLFEQAVGILRDIENGIKFIRDYENSGESQTVKNDDKLKKLRYFTIDNKKVYFDNHIKSLSNSNRIYFLEKEEKIHIGYIGKHLATKKFK